MHKQSFFQLPKSFFTTIVNKQSIRTILSQTHNHTFNTRLFNGSLDEQVFGKYLHDDFIYLHHYALVLNKLATKIKENHSSLARHLSTLHQEIISGEQDMHKSYSEYLADYSDKEPGEAISAYIKFLEHHAEHSPPTIALCCILPCFWIYCQLGYKELPPEQLAQNRYKAWIETYSSDSFREATTILVDTVDQLAIATDEQTQKEMEAAFEQAAQFELAFFEEVIEPTRSVELIHQ